MVAEDAKRETVKPQEDLPIAQLEFQPPLEPAAAEEMPTSEAPIIEKALAMAELSSAEARGGSGAVSADKEQATLQPHVEDEYKPLSEIPALEEPKMPLEVTGGPSAVSEVPIKSATITEKHAPEIEPAAAAHADDVTAPHLNLVVEVTPLPVEEASERLVVDENMEALAAPHPEPPQVEPEETAAEQKLVEASAAETAAEKAHELKPSVEETKEIGEAAVDRESAHILEAVAPATGIAEVITEAPTADEPKPSSEALKPATEKTKELEAVPVEKVSESLSEIAVPAPEEEKEVVQAPILEEIMSQPEAPVPTAEKLELEAAPFAKALELVSDATAPALVERNDMAEAPEAEDFKPSYETPAPAVGEMKELEAAALGKDLGLSLEPVVPALRETKETEEALAFVAKGPKPSAVETKMSKAALLTNSLEMVPEPVVPNRNEAKEIPGPPVLGEVKPTSEASEATAEETKELEVAPLGKGLGLASEQAVPTLEETKDIPEAPVHEVDAPEPATEKTKRLDAAPVTICLELASKPAVPAVKETKEIAEAPFLGEMKPTSAECEPTAEETKELEAAPLLNDVELTSEPTGRTLEETREIAEAAVAEAAEVAVKEAKTLEAAPLVKDIELPSEAVLPVPGQTNEIAEAPLGKEFKVTSKAPQPATYKTKQSEASPLMKGMEHASEVMVSDLVETRDVTEAPFADVSQMASETRKQTHRSEVPVVSEASRDLIETSSAEVTLLPEAFVAEPQRAEELMSEKPAVEETRLFTETQKLESTKAPLKMIAEPETAEEPVAKSAAYEPGPVDELMEINVLNPDAALQEAPLKDIAEHKPWSEELEIPEQQIPAKAAVKSTESAVDLKAKYITYSYSEPEEGPGRPLDPFYANLGRFPSPNAVLKEPRGEFRKREDQEQPQATTTVCTTADTAVMLKHPSEVTPGTIAGAATESEPEIAIEEMQLEPLAPKDLLEKPEKALKKTREGALLATYLETAPLDVAKAVKTDEVAGITTKSDERPEGSVVSTAASPLFDNTLVPKVSRNAFAMPVLPQLLVERQERGKAVDADETSAIKVSKVEIEALPSKAAVSKTETFEVVDSTKTLQELSTAASPITETRVVPKASHEGFVMPQLPQTHEERQVCDKVHEDKSDVHSAILKRTKVQMEVPSDISAAIKPVEEREQVELSTAASPILEAKLVPKVSQEIFAMPELPQLSFDHQYTGKPLQGQDTADHAAPTVETAGPQVGEPSEQAAITKALEKAEEAAPTKTFKEPDDHVSPSKETGFSEEAVIAAPTPHFAGVELLKVPQDSVLKRDKLAGEAIASPDSLASVPEKEELHALIPTEAASRGEKERQLVSRALESALKEPWERPERSERYEPADEITTMGDKRFAAGARMETSEKTEVLAEIPSKANFPGDKELEAIPSIPKPMPEEPLEKLALKKVPEEVTAGQEEKLIESAPVKTLEELQVRNVIRTKSKPLEEKETRAVSPSLEPVASVVPEEPVLKEESIPEEVTAVKEQHLDAASTKAFEGIPAEANPPDSIETEHVSPSLELAAKELSKKTGEEAVKEKLREEATTTQVEKLVPSGPVKTLEEPEDYAHVPTDIKRPTEKEAGAIVPVLQPALEETTRKPEEAVKEEEVQKGASTVEEKVLETATIKTAEESPSLAPLVTVYSREEKTDVVVPASELGSKEATREMKGLSTEKPANEKEELQSASEVLPEVPDIAAVATTVPSEPAGGKEKALAPTPPQVPEVTVAQEDLSPERGKELQTFRQQELAAPKQKEELSDEPAQEMLQLNVMIEISPASLPESEKKDDGKKPTAAAAGEVEERSSKEGEGAGAAQEKTEGPETPEIVLDEEKRVREILEFEMNLCRARNFGSALPKAEELLHVGTPVNEPAESPELAPLEERLAQPPRVAAPPAGTPKADTLAPSVLEGAQEDTEPGEPILDASDFNKGPMSDWETELRQLRDSRLHDAPYSAGEQEKAAPTSDATTSARKFLVAEGEGKKGPDEKQVVIPCGADGTSSGPSLPSQTDALQPESVVIVYESDALGMITPDYEIRLKNEREIRIRRADESGTYAQPPQGPPRTFLRPDTDTDGGYPKSPIIHHVSFTREDDAPLLRDGEKPERVEENEIKPSMHAVGPDAGQSAVKPKSEEGKTSEEASSDKDHTTEPKPSTQFEEGRKTTSLPATTLLTEHAAESAFASRAGSDEQRKFLRAKQPADEARPKADGLTIGAAESNATPEHRDVESTEEGATRKPGADAPSRVFLRTHTPRTQGESERDGGIESIKGIASVPEKDGEGAPRTFLRPAEPAAKRITEAMLSSEKHLEKAQSPEEKDTMLAPRLLKEGTPPAGAVVERQLDKDNQPLSQRKHLEEKAETPTKRDEKMIIVPREELATDARAATSTREVQPLVSQSEAAVAAADARKASSDLIIERAEIAQMAQPAKERQLSIVREPVVEQMVVSVHSRPSDVEKRDASANSAIERDLVAGAEEPTRSTPVSKDDLHTAISSDWDVMSRESLQGRPGTRTADTQTELSTDVRSKDVREASTYAFLSEETEEVRRAPDDYLPLYLHRVTLNDKAASAQITLLPVAPSDDGLLTLRRDRDRDRCGACPGVCLLDLGLAGPGVRLRDLDLLGLGRDLERERGQLSRSWRPTSSFVASEARNSSSCRPFPIVVF
ncbi:hypothetical protein HPB50_012202 [Hyalomma asiaticum]|uniref:Uncharacterized protein n=1 Tax=Hyalomma asiaticum TaxID=266040 RepID=A0ACB7STI9_HYAAI|nr:hypothetical protein HPB50_012202 [Hyalomma asiaticum]